MGRGVVSGLVWGLLVSVVVLAAVSLSLPLPQRASAPTTPAPQTEGVAAQTPDPVAAEQAPPPAVADPGPALAGAPATTPIAAPSLPAATDPAPMNAAAPAAIAGGDAVDAGPRVQAPAPAPSAKLIEAPAQPAPAMLPVAAPPLASPVEGGTTAAAPDRVMGQEPEDRLERVDTTPPPPPPAAPMPTPSLDPVPAPTQPLPQVAPPATAVVAPVPAPPEPAPPAADTLAPAAASPPPPEGASPALLAHAMAFDAPLDQPLLSVILIEDAANPLDPAILSQITFPLSFALDPLAPDAAARAGLLREAGFEVLILGGRAIPAGAQAADVEVALEAAKASLPQAVALIDDPASRIQGDRVVLETTVAVLAASGHGLVAFPRGTNTAETTALRAGVPVATAFRLLDDEDQRAPVITRYLDRAAFAAAQEGAVIVVGRTRPDTVTALFSWALGGRAEGIGLAPVSAVLTRLGQ